jgi:hypothetical protein
MLLTVVCRAAIVKNTSKFCTTYSECENIGFKHIYLSSIAKQVLATYINHFRVRFLEPTSTGVIWRNMVVTRVELEPMISGLRGRHLNHQATAYIWKYSFKYDIFSGLKRQIAVVNRLKCCLVSTFKCHSLCCCC